VEIVPWKPIQLAAVLGVIVVASIVSVELGVTVALLVTAPRSRADPRPL